MKKRRKLKVALIQLASGEDKRNNLRDAIRLLKLAVKKGAEFVLLPETFNFRGNPVKTMAQAEDVSGPSIKLFADFARQYHIWILAGSLSERVDGNKKAYNTSVVIGSYGKIKAVYRKMHLFDVSLGRKKILESKIYLRGRQPVTVSVAGIKTGLSICYDLRFPELYRRYSQAGVEMLCVPSSFAALTGKAHWEVLLRARAIENQCFVLAPSQYGIGASGVPAYGNSMIVDPWGNILARASKVGSQVVYAELDFNRLDKIRRELPALKHRLL